MSLWERFWAFPFYQHALLAGGATVVACAVLSVFVVHRRMAFVGQGISHAAFGGMAVALLLELVLPALHRPLIREALVAGFCIAVALFMGRLTRQRRLGADAAIGIVLAMAMALGVLLLDLRELLLEMLVAAGRPLPPEAGYTPAFHDILFGNVLTVTRVEVFASLIVAGGVVAWVAVVFKGLVFCAVDEEAAAVFGLPVDWLHYGLLVALGLTIVMAMRVLGVILAGSMLILPAATAGLWSRRVDRVFLLSILISLGCMVSGLAISMEFAVLSTGPVIVLLQGAVFLGSRLIARGA